MKRSMQIKYLKLCVKFVVLLLLISTTACSNDEEEPGYTVLAYEVIVEGDAYIEGLEVTMTRCKIEGDELIPIESSPDVTYTDSAGEFFIKKEGKSSFQGIYILRLRDVDGDKNGSYEDYEQIVIVASDDGLEGLVYLHKQSFSYRGIHLVKKDADK